MSELQEWYAGPHDRYDPREPRVQKPNWLAHAVRLCRDGTDGLAKHLKAVPASHVTHQAVESTVRCVCEEMTPLMPAEFSECRGSCGRYFVRDGEMVWAARLPK